MSNYKVYMGAGGSGMFGPRLVKTGDSLTSSGPTTLQQDGITAQVPLSDALTVLIQES